MLKKVFILLSALALSLVTYATHQRSGEILYKYLAPFTYEVTIVTYSYAPSPADRFELEINWGDGTTAILARSNGPLNDMGLHIGEIVGPDIRRNLYVGTHKYPAAANYIIHVEDPNRNMGILNIPNSVDVPLYIETMLIINPFIGQNSSPILELPPIDIGCIDKMFFHNPGAIDPDGDSLSYKLVYCRGTNGANIPGFQYPNEVGTNIGGSFSINPTTGDLIWDKPKMQGEYNFAFIVEEWRNGIRIGYVTRDMQVNILPCTNQPPVLHAEEEVCVTAGEVLNMKIVATDFDNDKIKLTASGDVFLATPPAKFSTGIVDSTTQNTAYLYWETACSNVRKLPYTLFVRATDNSITSLSSFIRVQITVIAPKVENVSANPFGNSIELAWDKHKCGNVAGYKIYRRTGFYGYTPDTCVTGMPSYTGYKLIATLGQDYKYVDFDVTRGVEYCYAVVAYFVDGAESYPSDEVCTQLKKDLPVITNVSVQSTDNQNGIMNIAWSKPTEIDPSQAPGPYFYNIYRSQTSSSDFVLINSTLSDNDTLYTDNQLNTKNIQYEYKIELVNNTVGNVFVMGVSQSATSPFLKLQPSDQSIFVDVATNVPWTNNEFVIYKYNFISDIFDSIAKTHELPFKVAGLNNDTEYCFKVKCVGSYGTPGIIDPLINFSQIACSKPFDNVPPCTPELTVETNCESFTNTLFFEPADITCKSDVAMSYIFYSSFENNTFVLLDSTNSFTYVTDNVLPTVSGCFKIQFIDINNNKSNFSDSVCVTPDICGKYRLPNLFTPNGDELNDFFKAFPYSGVESIELKIVNRWGQLVYETDKPDFKWDGKILNTKIDTTEGDYFYVCIVKEYTPQGIQQRKIQGSVTIRR